MADQPPLPPEFQTRIAEAMAGPVTDWPFPPIVPGDWDEPDASGTFAILELIGRFLTVGPLDQPVSVAHDLCRVRMRPLACYPGSLLIEALARAPWLGVVSCILHAKGVTFLDGSSPAIHILNFQAPIDLSTPEQRADYLALFMNWVRTEDGRFQIIQTPEDGQHRALDPASAELLRTSAQPWEIAAQPDAKGLWIAQGKVVYANAIFHSTLTMAANGAMDMLEDNPLHQDLALRAEVMSGLVLRLADNSEDAA